MARRKISAREAAQGQYDATVDEIVESLEDLCSVEAPVTEYLAALQHAKDRINEWLEASIEAALDDVKRQAGDQ